MNIKNFTQYSPAEKKFGDDAMYLQSEDGQDWYECQASFKPETLKIVYDNEGKVMSQSRDASALFPLNASVAEVDTELADVVGLYFLNGKIVTEHKPTPFHEWNGSEWMLSDIQQQAVIFAEKSAKREQINRKRDDVCFGGIYIETLGKWFDTDETSFVKMIGAKSVMDDDFANGQEVKPELWICADNSIVQLGRDELALIIRSIKQNVSAMHAVAVQHKMQLEQSEKPSEYDFSAGWSKTYAEYVNELNEQKS